MRRRLTALLLLFSSAAFSANVGNMFTLYPAGGLSCATYWSDPTNTIIARYIGAGAANFENTACNNLAEAGDTIACTEDQGANGYDLTGTGSGVTWETGQMNGEAVMDGGASVSGLASGSTGASAVDEVTVALVLEVQAGTFAFLHEIGGTGTQDLRFWKFSPGGSGDWRFDVQNESDPGMTADDLNYDQTYVFTMVVDYTDQTGELWVDGTSTDTDTTTGTATSYTHTNVSWWPIDSQVGEHIVYDGIMSDSERGDLETCLADKYQP